MTGKNFTLIAILCLSTFIVSAQKSKTASDSIQSKKELQRVNNTSQVEKINIPKLDPKPIVVTPVTTTMSKGENPGVQLDIPEVTVEDIQRDIEKSIKNKTKSKFVKSGNEVSIQQTIIKEIAQTPLNVFVKVTPLDSGARIITFVEDQGVFISENSDEDRFSKLKSFVKNFGAVAYREKVSDQVKSQEKILNDLESNLSKLKKQNEKMHTEISNNETAIVNSEVDIKANARQQELKNEEIIQQKRVVSSTDDKEAKKIENKKLNALEKEKNNFRDNVNSLNKKIVKSRANIEKLEEEIQVNLQEQNLLKDKITQQRSLVKGFQAKLEKIK